MVNTSQDFDIARKLRSLKITLTLAVLAVIVLVFGISSFMILESRSQHEREAELATANLANSVGGTVSGLIDRIDVVLVSVARETSRHLPVQNIRTPGLHDYFKSLEKEIAGLENLLLFDEKGRLITGAEGQTGENGTIAESEFFVRAKNDPRHGLVISKPHQDGSGRWRILIVRCFENSDGRFAGVVATPVSLENISSMFNPYKLGENGAILLMDSELSIVVIHPDPRAPGRTIGPGPTTRQLTESLSRNPDAGSYTAAIRADGVRRTVSYRKLSRHPFYVLVGQATDYYLEDWRSQAEVMLGLCLVITAVTLVSSMAVYGKRKKEFADELEIRLRSQTLEGMVAARTAEQKAILDNTFVGMALLRDRRFVWINKKMEEMFGYRMDELEGLPTESFYPSHESFERLGKDAYPELARSGFYTTEYRMKRKDGSLFWCSVSGQAIDQANLGLGTIWILQDITERKKSEDTLRKLGLAVENSPATVVITDKEGNIEYVNRKFTELTGYASEEALGQNPRILNAGVQPKEYFRELWETISAGKEWKGEFCNKKKNGEIFWEQALISPIYGQGGNITHYIAVKDDITERRKVAEELKLAKESAEAATRAKSQFLANMSHEIRTPLNAIIGMTELSLGMAENPKQRDYLVTARQASESLLVIINDILDFSKIEAGRLSVEEVDFRLEDTVEKAVDTLAFNAKSKGLEIKYHISGDLPGVVKGDPVRLKQVLINLIGNAVKFTNEGSVNLNVSRKTEENGASMLLFEVRDTGVGIPEDKLTTIFDSFSQADSSTTRIHGGTGLGLTISMNLVHLMGGSIWLESEQGKGSVFFFTTRLIEGDSGAAVKEKPGGPARAAETGSLDILLVEDNRVNQMLAVGLLEKMKHKVTVANNGREALSMLAQKSFDLVFMDVQMPEMDGLTATKAIRTGGGVADPEVPIIAMTANAMEGDREMCLQAGMDDYVSKPIRVPELLAAIERVRRA